MPRLLPLALAALALLLCACGRSAPTRYYLLEAATPPASTAALPARTLRLAPVALPEYLDRNGIVTRGPGTQVTVAQFHLWAESLQAGVRRSVQGALAPALLPTGVAVLAPSDEDKSDYLLQLDLQRLDGSLAGTAALEARWTLRDQHDAVLDRGVYTAEEAVPGSGETGADYAALTAAESRLVRGLGAHLAERLPPLLRGRP